MKTFTEAKELVENPHYEEQRRISLAELTDVMIDVPIVEHVMLFNMLHYCFTLQSCYGHFLYDGQENPHNLDPLPVTNAITTVEYRIAYIALCIEKNDPGRRLLGALKEVSTINPKNIQFGSADWFWGKQVNSYALQVEPDRFKRKDKAVLSYEEALKIERIRNQFFVRLGELLGKQED